MSENEPASTQREYVLGTNPMELERLGFQHRLWSRPANELWHRAGLRPGMRVLDVGCGPGFASLDIAQIVGPTGSVLGVDESEAFIAHAAEQAGARRLGQARFVVTDAAALEHLDDALPGTFDIAYVRWVFCFLAEPEAVLRAIARLLRPGGRLLVQDYFRYETMTIAPRSAAFDAVIGAIARSWRDRGGDPDIMGRLPALAAAEGLAIEHLARMDPGPAHPGATMWHWPETFWGVFLPRLEELGYITKAEREAFLEAWAQRRSEPGTFMHLPPMYEMIAARPA
jgi:SAM-dependent methyltransferase